MAACGDARLHGHTDTKTSIATRALQSHNPQCKSCRSSTRRMYSEQEPRKCPCVGDGGATCASNSLLRLLVLTSYVYLFQVPPCIPSLLHTPTITHKELINHTLIPNSLLNINQPRIKCPSRSSHTTILKR